MFWRKFLTFFLVLILFGCSPSTNKEKLDQQPITGVKSSTNDIRETDLTFNPLQKHNNLPVPWQVWITDSFGETDLERAEKSMLNGDLESAIQFYAACEKNAPYPKLKEEALIRRLGAELMLGRSNKVLEEVSRIARANQIESDQNLANKINPRIGFIVAFAYFHQKNIDQTLAWLSSVYRASSGTGELSNKVNQELSKILRTIAIDTFDAFSARWSTDPLISSYISQERLRRSSGGLPEDYLIKVWNDADQNSIIEPSSNSTTDGSIVIGVLLPFSGQYSQHAEHIKQGIELALSQNENTKVIIKYGDTRADPKIAEQEYERLVTAEGSSVILGPLLVKTTESVSTQSEKIGVPIISFSKRKNIPQLGKTVFRLGATVSDQISNLINYSTNQLNLKKIVMLYTKDESGMEYFDELQNYIKNHNEVALMASVAYDIHDENSIAAVIKKLNQISFDSIFFTDSVENVGSVFGNYLQELRHQKNITFLGTALWDDPAALWTYASLITPGFYVSPFSLSSRNPDVLNFQETFTQHFNSPPDLLSAQAFDATKLILKLIDLSGNSIKDIRRKLEHADSFYGITGILQVDHDGDFVRRMSVFRIIDTQVIEVVSQGRILGAIVNEQNSTVQKEAFVQ